MAIGVTPDHSDYSTGKRMFGWLKKTDWKSSPPHLLLLSKFLRGDSPSRYAAAEHWKSVLKEGPKEAIQRFVEDKMLEPASLAELVDFKFKASELKDMLKARQLKVSGRKPELIARLVESDMEGMVAATSDVQLLRCTPEAARIAEKYVARQDERRATTENEVLRLLERRDYVKAVRAVVAFEATQVFPRGLGIDWSNYDGSSDIKALKTIFETKPRILDDINNDLLENLRVSAGMMQLWGTNRAAPWLSEDFTTGIHLDADSAARMLVFYASHLRVMEQYKEAGVRTAEVMAVGDNLTCSACHAINGKKYRLEAALELPYANCTCEIGCRCTTVAAGLR